MLSLRVFCLSIDYPVKVNENQDFNVFGIPKDYTEKDLKELLKGYPVASLKVDKKINGKIGSTARVTMQT